MLDIDEKLSVISEMAADFNYRKRRNWIEETNSYEDQEGFKERNEYVEQLKRAFVEVALKEIAKGG